MHLEKFLDSNQRRILREVRALIKDFSETNDNSVTYNLQGLLLELTQDWYQSPEYLREKLEKIITAAET